MFTFAFDSVTDDLCNAAALVVLVVVVVVGIGLQKSKDGSK